MEQALLFISRRLLYLIALMLLAFLVFAVSFSYPTTIQQRMKVISLGGASPVYSPMNGYVVNELAQTGDAVKRDQPLLVVQTPEGGKIEIVSNADGYYVGAAERRTGRTVLQSELLGSVLEPDPLAAQMFVEPKDIGHIRPGMKVIMKLDAFPYQTYGSLLGSVTEVSNIPTAHGEMPAYLVNVSVDDIPSALQDHVRMDLQGSAEIVTGEQRLIAKLFPRIRNAGSAID